MQRDDVWDDLMRQQRNMLDSDELDSEDILVHASFWQRKAAVTSAIGRYLRDKGKLEYSSGWQEQSAEEYAWARAFGGQPDDAA